MNSCTRSFFIVVVMVIVCRYCSAECNPTPPNDLTVPPLLMNIPDVTEVYSKSKLLSHIYQFSDVNFSVMVDFRPKIGNQSTDWWAVFSASQVRKYGLWCQVLPEDNMGMGNNVGDWYYSPGDTPDGLTLVPTSYPSNNVPYQSLKCTNQIGLVVRDDDVTNNQGIVRCTTTITELERKSNYIVVYSDSVFNSYSEW